MKSSLRLIVIKGIPVEIHISWLVIFLLLTVSLARGYFPEAVEGYGSMEYWIAGVLTTLVVFASVLTHEFGHSLVAIREGIPIQKITLFIFGGISHMESDPTSPSTELKVTAAGPLTSLLIAAVMGAIYFLVMPPGLLISEAVLIVASVNLVMAIFNLIPAFPLDGGRLFRSIAWVFSKNVLTATRIAVSIGSFFSFLIMALGFTMIFFQGNIGGLWLIFIGWMIYQAGQTSYSQLVYKDTFEGMKVSELMSTDLKTISPEATMDELADHFLHYHYGAFPVVYGSTTHGLVTLQHMKETPREQWSETRVSQIMTPLKDAMVLKPDADASDVMMQMASKDTGRALVMENGNLVGLLSRTDMMRYIQTHMALGSK